METVVEHRKQARTDMLWPVSAWIPQANRFFNGRSTNVSKTGAFVRLPVTTPVRQGQLIELNFPRTETLAKEKGQFARIKIGTVVRVNRKDILNEANVGVAVQFDSE